MVALYITLHTVGTGTIDAVVPVSNPASLTVEKVTVYGVPGILYCKIARQRGKPPPNQNRRLLDCGNRIPVQNAENIF